MKTRITVLVSGIAIITLSFSFANVNEPSPAKTPAATAQHSEPVGGLFADEVVE